MVFRKEIKLVSKDRAITFHNITKEIKKAVNESGIKNGIVSVYSHHTTCSIITQEQAFDLSVTGLETLQQDFVEALEKIMPDCKREGIYLHPGPKAAIIGRSENITLIDGNIDLGDFANVYFIDFDVTRGRNRTVQVTVLGE